ncbi:hypothetical protein GE09DRAFT_1083687 [Coniochaeta sp. 2T2.1]|nr:hypothetical protein GE09DRAFT_1083687 [Coniochaeta sp. 2T2.1]
MVNPMSLRFWSDQPPPAKVLRRGANISDGPSRAEEDINMENAEPSDSRIPGGSGLANDDINAIHPKPTKSCIAGSGPGRVDNNELKIKGEINEFNTEPITLDVRGRPFFTTVGTICTRNSFFPTLLSGKWKIPLTQDGALFVDSDPDVFNHIWQFLRHGAFPIAFQADGKTHDHKMYQDILFQARYFCMPELEAWLENRCYYGAVTLSTAKRLVGPDEERDFTDSDITKVEFLPCKVETEPVWHCLDWKTHPFHPGSWVRESRTLESPSAMGKYGSIVKTSYLEVRREVEYHGGWTSCYG